MQLKNVKLIFFREMRDQLRDRRTLFLIAVLPLLLYPLLGMSFFQLSQFLQHHAAKVLVLGAEELKDIEWLPRLMDDKHFDEELFDDPQQRENLELMWPKDFDKAGLTSASEGEELETAARRLVDEGRVEAVLQFPEGFGDRLREVRRASVARRSAGVVDMPEVVILSVSADEKSQLAHLRLEQVLRQWRNDVMEKNLAASDVPQEAARPFEVVPRDLSQARQRQAAMWSKILPFFVFIWALTGAFYPAVDLCAGEKERGTLETLLTSPALRREIVWGKLLTIMTFSMATALLNLTSLGLTGKFVIDQLNQVPGLEASGLAMPPLDAVAWLALALVPISALFGALCLACAAFARSTKEGQYYLMPLMLVTMPLMLLPMSPGVDLNLGNSIVPVTGLVLLMRSVIEGQYHLTGEFVACVAAVTTVTFLCCLLAIRWAEEQFNRESVLFRESERLELGRWIVHMVRDRGDTPSFGQAMLCVAIILIIQFFISMSLSAHAPGEMSFAYLARTLVVSQVGCIFAPVAIMTIMLTRRPARTLLLERWPRAWHVAAAAALAVVMHPLAKRLSDGIRELYPVGNDALAGMKSIGEALDGAPSWWMVVALMGLLPAICEELALRGFVLSGLRHIGHKWWAIGISAIAFGAIHMFLQQKIAAAAVGLAIGYLAVQTGSLVPCIVFHAIHNSLGLYVAHLAAEVDEANPQGWTARLVSGEEPMIYGTAVVALCGVCAAAILWSLRGAPYRPTEEEQLEEARHRQDASLAGA